MTRRLLRRWWVRWIALPLLLLVTAHACWTLALKWEFERRIEALRASGAPVELSDLRRPRIPDEDNAAALWRQAHEWYEEHIHMPAVALYNRPESMWDEDDRAAMAEYLSVGDPYVDLLARAAAKPAMWQDLNWEAGPAMEVRAIPEMQEAVTYLDHRVRFAERAPDALREISVMLDLAPKMERPILICMLVRWTVDGIAADSLKALASKPGFDPCAGRAWLDPRFAAADDPSLPRDALRGERVFALGMSRRWISGETPRHAILGEDATGFLDTVAESWLARPLAYQDGLRLLDIMEEALRLIDLPPREALPRAVALRQQRSGLPYICSGLLAPLPAKTIEGRMKHEARMRIARVGLALLELRQTTGAWPETLDAVVPMVGEEWTLDPFTGERLQYEPGVRLEAAAPIADEELREDDEIVWRFGS